MQLIKDTSLVKESRKKYNFKKAQRDSNPGPPDYKRVLYCCATTAAQVTCLLETLCIPFWLLS